MATNLIAVQDIARTGLEPTYTAATSGADGDVWQNEGRRTFLHVKNGSGGSIDVTITTPNTVDGLAVADLVVAVPAGEERMIGPFPRIYEAYDTDNSIESAIQATYSSVTSLTVAAIKLPAPSY
jgi:hypothetical protein